LLSTTQRRKCDGAKAIDTLFFEHRNRGVEANQMSIESDEKDFYPHVSNFFLEQDYFVVSGWATKPGIEGSSEFGFTIYGQPMRCDIAAARWNSKQGVEAVAVECKRLGSMNRSVGAGLWQAIDYQVAFDKVFIATEASGRIRHMSSVIHSLGIGHMTVDATSGICQVKCDGEFRNVDRFDESVRRTQVIPRLAMFLAFRDILGFPLRYGETFDGGGYVAKNVGTDIQYNAWVNKNTGDMFFGINVEHIDSFRRLLKTMDWEEFCVCLRNLKGYDMSLVKDPVPKWRSKTSVNMIKDSASYKADVNVMKAALAAVVNDLPRRCRPHLSIYSRLCRGDEVLLKDDYLARLKSSRDCLSDIMQILTVGTRA